MTKRGSTNVVADTDSAKSYGKDRPAHHGRLRSRGPIPLLHIVWHLLVTCTLPYIGIEMLLTFIRLESFGSAMSAV